MTQDDDFIDQIEHLTFRALATPNDSFPAKDFVLSLPADAQRDFRVAARILATSLASGRPPSGRACRVVGSSQRLFELRITPPGRRGAHARLLYVVEGDTVYVARGLLKRERITRNEIELADAIVARWRADR